MLPIHEVAWTLAAGLLVCAYSGAALLVALHLCTWLHLLWLRRQVLAQQQPQPEDEDLPFILVQLPIYNEGPVVGPLLQAVAALDWPRDRLRVQVLDDSTDDSPERIAALLPALRAAGLQITHLRRGHREGFKAGALAHGLEQDEAPLVAILDADFRPRPSWLAEAYAALAPGVGLVQCRWAFLNADHSLLTRAQALHLDAHFALEQVARSGGGLLMGFNGTAGLWRRSCIEAAGGWEGDTLTEDLDLAYRAQLAGQVLRYVDEIAVPCELPEGLSAVRSQQHRWIRGGAQVGRKLLGRLWRSDQARRRRLHGAGHLLASSVFLPVLALCTLSPLLPASLHFGPRWLGTALLPASLLLRGVLGVILLAYGTVCVQRSGAMGAGLLRLLRDLPPFLVLVTAITAHNARAAWMGWRGPTGSFVRTPKGGQVAQKAPLPDSFAAETVLTLLSWLGLASAIAWAPWGMGPFLAVQALAFSLLVVWTLAEQRAAPAAAATPGAAPAP